MHSAKVALSSSDITIAILFNYMAKIIDVVQMLITTFTNSNR
jgi:hypothetical protein